MIIIMVIRKTLIIIIIIIISNNNNNTPGQVRQGSRPEQEETMTPLAWYLAEHSTTSNINISPLMLGLHAKHQSQLINKYFTCKSPMCSIPTTLFKRPSFPELGQVSWNQTSGIHGARFPKSQHSFHLPTNSGNALKNGGTEPAHSWLNKNVL